MLITDDHLTRISYIEAVLGIKCHETDFNGVVKFIQENFMKARKAEPTFKEFLHSNWRSK
jgi:hypothetical protein